MDYVIISKRAGRKHDKCAGRFPTLEEAQKWLALADEAWGGRPPSKRPQFTIEAIDCITHQPITPPSARRGEGE